MEVILEFWHGNKPQYAGVFGMLLDGAWHVRIVIQRGDDARNVSAHEFFEPTTLARQLRHSGLGKVEITFDQAEVVIRTQRKQPIAAEARKLKQALTAYYPEHDGIACTWSVL